MAAARALLLGDLQGVLALARRRYGYLLVDDKSGSQGDETAIFHALTLLRAQLQRCEHLSDLTPALVLRPFLDLVRHEDTSSVLTSAALEAVHHFLDAWPWDAVQDASAISDAVSDVVDAVSQCRFQETSAESDANVIVLVVDVLTAVLTSRAAPCLSDHSMWQLVESLYALSRASRHDRHIPPALRAAATSSLHDAITFIFTSPSVYADASPPQAVALSVGFGLPCAVKAMGFLCQKLHQRSSGSAGASRREVLLALSLLHSALLACDAPAITRVPALMLFIKDDLCSGVLRFARLGASSDAKIPLRCLALVRLLWTKLRSVLKMQLEAIVNGVFCNALHWTLASLDVASPNFPRDASLASSKSVLASPSAGSTAGPAARDASKSSHRRVDAASDEFTGDASAPSRLFAASFEILDCLVDLLAEPTLLPDLYVNYDCDGNRSDLTLNLFELLAHVVAQSHSACVETLDEAHFHWAQAIGELALRGLFNALYVVYVRSQHKAPKAAADRSAGSGHSDDDDDSDGLLDERVTSPRGAVGPSGFATAEALHKRRQRKKFFQHGIHEFNRKPIAGIKYLQQNAFLPTPLDPRALAAFLRSLPQGLHKNAVGVYLGAMGKDVKDFERAEIHEADTMDFHRDVLAHFVESFNFEGESVVAALRMFLASFRLPGEAQQIDRILNTFSLQVYAQCRDRCLLASPDVAYLLSFSLIMLNTDLHNPNIRPEKKMSRSDFVRNNRNYGHDVSRGQDLPDDFLHALYDAIARDEIKTFEDGGKHGEVTTDRWKDLLQQAETDPRNSHLIVHHRLHDAAGTVHAALSATHQSPRAPLHRHVRRVSAHGSTEAVATAAATRTSATGSDQYDRHIFELVQPQLVRAFASVFEQFARVSNRHDGVHSAGDAALSLDTRSMSDTTAAAHEYVPEKSMLQLAGNGLVLCAGAASHLALVEPFNAIFARLCSYTALFASDVYPLGYGRREDGVWLFCTNQSASVATAGVLKLVETCSLSLSRQSWAHFFHAMSALREFQALPPRVLRHESTAAPLLTDDECAAFVDLVYANKDARAQREELKRQAAAASAGSSSSGFFSGVAWLMAAFETQASGVAHGRGGHSREAHVLDDDELPSNPVEWAEFAQDLVVQTLRDRDDAEDAMGNGTAANDGEVEFGTEAWIRATLAPYRVASLVQDVFSLPPRALVEILRALDDETIRALTGSSPVAAQTHGRRRSSKKLRGGSASEDDVSPHEPLAVRRVLSPSGCVLFEHFFSLIIAQSDSVVRDGASTDDGDDESDSRGEASVLALLEAHYAHVLQALLPILVGADDDGAVEPRGDPDAAAPSPARVHLSYENACFVLQKALDGVFALACKRPSDRTRDLLTHVLATLVDASGDDELVRPFLSQLLAGLHAFIAVRSVAALPDTREQWLLVTNLISWSVASPGAAPHGFALLSDLVHARAWRRDGSALSISDVFTKALMFALVREQDDGASGGATDRSHALAAPWQPLRALELLETLLTSLGTEDSATDGVDSEALTLRFLGGIFLVCHQLVTTLHAPEHASDAAAATPQSLNETIVKSLALVQELLLGSSRSAMKRDLRPTAWLEVLECGLLPLGYELLHGKRASVSDASAAPRSILYYEKQLVLSGPPLHERPQQQSRRPEPTRRRRPSVAKDPFALRPHVLMVQLLSAVVCDELQALAQCEAFPRVWDDLADLLVALLRHTELASASSSSSAGSDAAGGDLALAALERRSVLSAHEEILEHAKSITRRLAALELAERSARDASELDRVAEDAAAAHYASLVHALVEKCQAVPGLFEQLFPSPDDSGSAGETTPPLLEGDDDDDDGESGDAADAAA